MPLPDSPSPQPGQPFSVGNATVRTQSSPGALSLYWRGRSDERFADRMLRTYFTACVSRARAERARLKIHLEELAFANSSSIGALIHVISLSHEHAVHLTVTYSSALKWQVLCIRALHWAARHPGTSFVDANASPLTARKAPAAV